MTNTGGTVFSGIADAIADTLPCAVIPVLADEDLLTAVREVEAVGRRVDALRVLLAGEVADRSRKDLGTRGLAVRRGCRNPVELLQRVALIAGSTAHRRTTLGTDLRPRVSALGEVFPARFPHIAHAIAGGVLGIDSASAISQGLGPLLPRVSPADVAGAEQELVTAASTPGIPTTDHGTVGTVGAAGAVGGGGWSADEVRYQVSVWQAVLDPDGLEPAEATAMAGRRFHIGGLRRGLVQMRIEVFPEAAGRVVKFFDAHLSPTTAPTAPSAEATTARTATGDTAAGDTAGDTASGDTAAGDVPGVPVVDGRSRDQQRHDIFIALIDATARSKDTPMVGGAAPTVLVTVHADDLAAGRPVGFSDGVATPLSGTTVGQLICTGGTQNVVLNAEGRIIALGSPERCFTWQQRRAITVRDGGCLIPGCTIPASWCEIHHVTPDRDHGPTHTDNGVLLCWFHHRTIETSGWQIRMTRGVPYVKAPPWIDPTAPWRHASKARTTTTHNTRITLTTHATAHNSASGTSGGTTTNGGQKRPPGTNYRRPRVRITETNPEQ